MPAEINKDDFPYVSGTKLYNKRLVAWCSLIRGYCENGEVEETKIGGKKAYKWVNPPCYTSCESGCPHGHLSNN
jgi:hypothetical protein